MAGHGGRGREPERLQALIEGELGLFGSQPPVPLALVKAWDEAVGEQVARRSRPSRLKGATLHVKVASSAWMHELQLLAPVILAKLAERPALARVKELRFELGPIPRTTAAQAVPAEPPRAVRRARREPALPGPIASALEKVDDDALRERIQGVLDQVLEGEDDEA
jgi:hypothetical protein